MKNQTGQMMIELLLAISLVSFLIISIISYQLNVIAQINLSSQKIIAYSALSNLVARFSLNQTAAEREKEFSIWQQTDLSRLKKASANYHCDISQCSVTVKNKNFTLSLKSAI